MNTPSHSSSATIPDRPLDSRALLTQLYWSAVKAVAPGAALKAALDRLPPGAIRSRVWVIAIGKAAHPMAIAAVEVLERQQLEPTGGVIVAPRVLPSPHPAIELVAGDHPVPSARSVAAAARIGDIVASVKPDDGVWVLLSGGASSLMAAPEGA